MTERLKEEKSVDEPGGSDSDDGKDGESGKINDPLTRRDVEAPRVPFESGASQSE